MIPQCKLGSCHTQLTCLPPCRKLKLLIYYISRAVAERSSDRNISVSVPLLYFIIGRVHRELSRPVCVVDLSPDIGNLGHGLAAQNKIIHIKRSLIHSEKLTEEG